MMITKLRLSIFLAALLGWLSGPSLAADDLPGVTSIEGRFMPWFQEESTDRFVVLALREEEEEPRPVPFQIGERDHKQRWAAYEGPKPNRDESPGRFDSNDAVFVMNRDLGGRADPQALPEQAVQWAEVRVGPESDPLGWVYVGLFPESEERMLSDHDYVRYDPETQRIFGERYAVDFSEPFPKHVASVEELGDFGDSLIHTLRAKGEAHLLGGLFTFRRTEKDIKARVRSYRDGPVRVLRRSRYWIPLPLGFSAKAKIGMAFYRDFAQGIAVARVRIPPKLVPASGELSAWFDFLNETGGRVILPDPQQKRALSFPLEDATLVDGRGADWAALELPDGRVFLLAVRRGGALGLLDQELYLSTPAASANGSTSNPGFGFRLSGVSRLTTGNHRLSVFVMLLDRTDPDHVRRAAEILLAPPAVSASKLEHPAGTTAK